jgi:hypothetical protein
MGNRELLEYIAAQLGNLAQDVGKLTYDIGKLQDIVVRMEQDHGRKIEVLLDECKQNTEKLDRIEQKISV